MKSLNIKFPLAVAILLALASCSTKPDATPGKILLIGHRASGAGVKNGYIENTIPAAVETLKYADGVEVDIQMSKDKTLWIYHDDLLNYNCDSDSISEVNNGCIPSLNDSIIGSIRICREGITDRIYRLSELFERYADYSDKFMSLDVKGYYDESCIPGHNVDGDYLTDVANGIADLIAAHNMTERVFVETDYTYLFEKLNEINPKIKCHVLGYGDLNKKIDRCVANNWQGISFNMTDTSLTAANVEALKAAGLELQLWTVRNEDDLKKALQFEPTSVQVSSVELLETIQTNGIQTFY